MLQNFFLFYFVFYKIRLNMSDRVVPIYRLHPVYNEQKRRNKTRCRSLTLTLKGFVFMPLIRTQTSDCLYNTFV